MNISIFVCAIIVFACSIGGLVNMVKCAKLYTKHKSLRSNMTKFEYFGQVGAPISLTVSLLGLMVGSVIAISEQLGFCSHNQVMYLLDLADEPYAVMCLITIIFCGINLFTSYKDLQKQS